MGKGLEQKSQGGPRCGLEQAGRCLLELLQHLSLSQFYGIVPQLDKCLNFMAFRGVILYGVQPFLFPGTDLNFRHPVVALWAK